MINILIPGKSYEVEDIFFIEECPRCHCQFEFQESDSINVLRNWLTKEFYYKEFYYDVKCPACGLQITGYSNSLQRRVVAHVVEPSGNSNINPTEDTALIIHSNWRAEDNPSYSPFDPTMDSEVYFCNNCNNKQYKMSNYCPCCGAKMDKKVKPE